MRAAHDEAHAVLRLRQRLPCQQSAHQPAVQHELHLAGAQGAATIRAVVQHQQRLQRRGVVQEQTGDDGVVVAR